MVAKEEATMESNNCSNNDPWVPLPDDGPATSQRLIAPAPENPLSKMIESEHYIQALERKLAQISKTRKGEPSSKDIITSLALYHDDQMRRYISETEIIDFGLATCSRSVEVPQASFVQRKLHPEKQPLNAEEIAELVKEDVLAKIFEETMSSITTQTGQTSLDLQTQSSLVSEPSESAADLVNTSTADGTHKPSDQEVNIEAAVEPADGTHKQSDQEVDIEAAVEPADGTHKPSDQEVNIEAAVEPADGTHKQSDQEVDIEAVVEPADGTHKPSDQEVDIEAAVEPADENWAHFDEFV